MSAPQVPPAVRWTLWVLLLLAVLTADFWAHMEKNAEILRYEKTVTNLKDQIEIVSAHRDIYKKLWVRCEVEVENPKVPTSWDSQLAN